MDFTPKSVGSRHLPDSRQKCVLHQANVPPQTAVCSRWNIKEPGTSLPKCSSIASVVCPEGNIMRVQNCKIGITIFSLMETLQRIWYNYCKERKDYRIGSKMEEREGGRSETPERSGVDVDAGEVWLVNLAKDASRSYQRKKEKLETETSLPEKSIFDLETSDCREDVADQQKIQASTADAAQDTTHKTVESEENSVVRFEVGAKVRPGLRFPSTLRRQVLEDLQRLPEVEVCKR